jgi:hypothetical protein
MSFRQRKCMQCTPQCMHPYIESVLQPNKTNKTPLIGNCTSVLFNACIRSSNKTNKTPRIGNFMNVLLNACMRSSNKTNKTPRIGNFMNVLLNACILSSNIFLCDVLLK